VTKTSLKIYNLLDKVAALHKRVEVEKMVALGANYNVAYGFNTLFFRMCSAKYVLTLEEDWLFAPAPALPGAHATYWRQHIVRGAMLVLQAEPSISGVILRSESYDHYCVRKEFQTLSSSDDCAETLEYRQYCMNLPSGYPWGSFTNGPSIYERQRLLKVGVQYGEPQDK
jgi:hypothetical protein